MNRVYNFSAGPATLPTSVLREVKEELLDYAGRGRSIMEMSHRSEEYEAIDKQAKQRIKDLVGLDDRFHILFLQGGASAQFMQVPLNLLREDQTADYIDTGRWSAKAIKEAERYGQINVAYSSADDSYDHVPSPDQLELADDAQFVHFTSNNTVAGTQFPTEPETNGVPLICDASSDFLSRSIDVGRYGLIYAGAQKNAGPAGVTVVIIRDDLLQASKTDEIPTILNYRTHAEKIFNTPPVFAVYVMNKVLGWIEDQGGIPHFERLNQQKAQLIYDIIDEDEYYRGAVREDSRSLMNITFRLPSEELEAKFLKEAEENELVTLKGHRSVGGIRASIYNAMSMDGVLALAEFMKIFRAANG
ncbi:MAG: 3-phosphoserine/phosphohydroxythreonine transaminase [Bacteroidota bacterium]